MQASNPDGLEQKNDKVNSCVLSAASPHGENRSGGSQQAHTMRRLRSCALGNFIMRRGTIWELLPEKATNTTADGGVSTLNLARTFVLICTGTGNGFSDSPPQNNKFLVSPRLLPKVTS